MHVSEWHWYTFVVFPHQMIHTIEQMGEAIHPTPSIPHEESPEPTHRGLETSDREDDELTTHLKPSHIGKFHREDKQKQASPRRMQVWDVSTSKWKCLPVGVRGGGFLWGPMGRIGLDSCWCWVQLRSALGCHPLLSDAVTLCSQQGHQRPDMWWPVYGMLHIKYALTLQNE